MWLQTDHDCVVLGNPQHQAPDVARLNALVIALLAQLGITAKVRRPRCRDYFGKLVGKVNRMQFDLIDSLRIIHLIEQIT
jgi:hypothetical protein